VQNNVPVPIIKIQNDAPCKTATLSRVRGAIQRLVTIVKASDGQVFDFTGMHISNKTTLQFEN